MDPQSFLWSIDKMSSLFPTPLLKLLQLTILSFLFSLPNFTHKVLFDLLTQLKTVLIKVVKEAQDRSTYNINLLLILKVICTAQQLLSNISYVGFHFNELP